MRSHACSYVLIIRDIINSMISKLFLYIGVGIIPAGNIITFSKLKENLLATTKKYACMNSYVENKFYNAFTSLYKFYMHARASYS